MTRLQPTGGKRILVDRLWPRGLSKESEGRPVAVGDRALDRAAQVVLYGARDQEHNEAVVLAKMMAGR